MMLALVAVALLSLYFYYKVKYFTLRQPIAGLSPHFLLGNLLQSDILFRRVSLPEACSNWKARFGDIFQFWVGPTRLIAVNNLTDVQHIFSHRHIYDQGDIYVKQFSIVIPHGLISSKGSLFLLRSLSRIFFCHSQVPNTNDMLRWRCLYFVEGKSFRISI